jgi:protease IV
MRRFFLILLSLFLLVVIGFLVWLMTPDWDLFTSSNRIGVVEVRGMIDNVQESLKAIKDFRKDPNVKCILVRIESPGGGIGASQELYREIRRTLEEKPVVASLGGIAASGGYYIASAAHRIVANPGTITGSIGVISYFPNLKDLLEKIGFAAIVIKSGRFKDIGNPDRDMTQEEKELLQATMDQAHRQFIRDVARGRNLAEEDVREIADGRIIMGETAQQLGLVDELGNFEDAVRAAKVLGKIQGEPDLIHAKKKKRSLLDFLLGTEISEQLDDYVNRSLNFLRYQVPYWP